MSLIEKQKQVADKVLEDIFFIDPYAIVAGGAPRDWHFEMEATDIDVFFHAGRTITCRVMDKMLSKVLPVASKCVYDVDLPVSYEKNRAVRSVRSYVIDGINVQLIELNIPSFDIVETFPVNMSMACYKNGKIHLERDFLIGEKSKLLYITNKLYGLGDVYIKKISDKFSSMSYNWVADRKQAEDILLNKIIRGVE